MLAWRVSVETTKILQVQINPTLSLSMGVSRMRATSRATFPCPSIATSSTSKLTGKALSHGRPLYHPTNLRAETTLLSFSPFRPSSRSLSAPYAWQQCNNHFHIHSHLFLHLTFVIWIYISCYERIHNLYPSPNLTETSSQEEWDRQGMQHS